LNTALNRLNHLQQQINGAIEPDTPDYLVPRLNFFEVSGRLFVGYYGSSWLESYESLFSVLTEPEVAERLTSLRLWGPDEGANGTREWNLSSLTDGSAHFPALRTFWIQLTEPTDHNRSIVTSRHEPYEEDGVLARLLSKAPALQSLSVPSAPSPEFFRVGCRPIDRLRVDAGYDHQDFILNLSASSCFPELHFFEFGEFNETYLDDYQESCTPLAHYQSLFESPAFRTVRSFIWKNPRASDGEIAALRALRPDLTVAVVRISA
jgi:hypothetical protein